MPSDAVAAQAEANRGTLVMAVSENQNPKKPGHIAIVRPGLIGAATLDQDGPMVTQAGGRNALSVSLELRRMARDAIDGAVANIAAQGIDWGRIRRSRLQLATMH